VLTIRETPDVRMHILWLAHMLPEPSSSLPNHAVYPHRPGAAYNCPEIPGSFSTLLSELLQMFGMAISGAHSDDLKKSGSQLQLDDLPVWCEVSGRVGGTDDCAVTSECQQNVEKQPGCEDVEAALQLNVNDSQSSNFLFYQRDSRNSQSPVVTTWSSNHRFVEKCDVAPN